MPTYYEDLMEERDTLSGTIEQTVTAAQESGGLSDEDKTKIATMQKRVASIDSELTILATEQDSLKKANEFAAKFMRSPRPATEERKHAPVESTGSAFVKSDEYRAYGSNPAGKSNYFEFAEAQFEERAATETGGLYIPKPAHFIDTASDQFPLFGLVSMEQVSSGSFEYVRSQFDDNAAVVPEGDPKPESTYTEVITPGALDTIAHWTQVTRQALEDSNRIRSVIDGKLTNGVQKKTHASITDVINATVLPTASGATLLAAIRQGIGVVQAAGWYPNAVLLNPADWADLDITVMGGTLTGPEVRQKFWGLTPVSSVGQPAGTATVGDFKQGVTLFYRAGVGVYATDSHASTFTSNIFTLLAERRSKAAVLDPSAMCDCTGGAPLARSAKK